MTGDDRAQAIFGAADGLTSTIAVVIAQLISGTRHSLLAGGFAVAIAAGVGMGWSEWLGDKTASSRRAVVMAVATLLASTLPILPFLILWRTAGIIACAIVAALLAATVATLRGQMTVQSHAQAWFTTVGGIIIVSGLVSIPSVLVG